MKSKICDPYKPPLGGIRVNTTASKNELTSYIINWRIFVYIYPRTNSTKLWRISCAAPVTQVNIKTGSYRSLTRTRMNMTGKHKDRIIQVLDEDDNEYDR